MLRRFVVANGGEIPLRVINPCRELGIRTVAVYSEADRNSLHVRFADEAICIGPPRPADSYLNVPAVISAAEIADVDGVHPGYGLLSENANFAEVCRASNIKFIGPQPHIEFQVLADEHGNVVTLNERECSIQRRHQKLIEEAPSLQVTPKMREEIGRTLCRCLTDIGYQNAGTVEFLMDEDHKL